jgi:hypothetical protein
LKFAVLDEAACRREERRKIRNCMMRPEELWNKSAIQWNIWFLWIRPVIQEKYLQINI